MSKLLSVGGSEFVNPDLVVSAGVEWVMVSDSNSTDPSTVRHNLDCVIKTADGREWVLNAQPIVDTWLHHLGISTPPQPDLDEVTASLVALRNFTHRNSS